MTYNLETKYKQLNSSLEVLANSKIEVIDVSSVKTAIKNAKLHVSKWYRVDDVVCVFSDLKGSTEISFDKQKKTMARFFEYLNKPLIQIHTDFGAEFIDVKGDGGIFLYTGKDASVRALLAAITFKSFVEQHIQDKIKKDYNIDFIVDSGIAKGDLLVKRVGQQKDNFPVWAGETVNMAALICKTVKKKHLNQDNKMFIGLQNKIYQEVNISKYEKLLIKSCGCGANGSPESLWTTETIPGRSGEQYHYLKQTWCKTHGQHYLDKILQIIND